MKSYFFDQGCVNGRFEQDVLIKVSHGKVASIATGVKPDDQADVVGGTVLPGMINVHSHAFQWKFAGQSEFQTGGKDSFWTWRKQMYDGVLSLGEDDLRDTERLYRLMVKMGYTSVGEFHYVHRSSKNDGQTQSGLFTELMVEAALAAGMRICIIPVLYQRGGFEDQPLTAAQKCFETTDDQFLNTLEKLADKYQSNELVTIGMAIHSLRAVAPGKIGRTVENFESITGGGPIHIHVAEQDLEVQDCLKATGLRPVELLFNSADVDKRWCLIHATHMTNEETDRLAESEAVVGLCPTTEANLGDGFFPAERFLKASGQIAIGSDSNVCIDPFSELRLLECGRRLFDQRRAILCSENDSCGEFLFRAAAMGGAQALGIKAGAIEKGKLADWIVLNESHPMLENVEGSTTIDRAVFCEYGSPVKRVMIDGQWQSE